MTEHKSIFIKNIYYMLSYAYKVLRESNYASVAAEEFDQAQDLLAAILCKGIGQQVKHGLHKEYVTIQEDRSVLRGKLNLSNTIRNRVQRKQKLSCEFDELSADHVLNQILKTTVHYLLADDGVAPARKVSLKKILVFFDEIHLLDPRDIQWGRLHHRRNDQNHEILIDLCYLVLNGMLQTTEEGRYRMMSLSDEHMERLYERFILNYYKRHHPYLSEIKAKRVRWALSGDDPASMMQFLPSMQTDVMLRLDEKVLIIDAKYYSQILQTHFKKEKLRSSHVYQIYAYVKNEDQESTGNVAGLLLYAKTDEQLTPDWVFDMGGNRIGAKTLDLNQDFDQITAQLDAIVEDHFGSVG